MTTLNLTPSRNPVSGKLDGSYEPVASGVNFIGTVGHGNTLTITDSLSRFGTRVNTKPLFVNLCDSLSGSSLGRITTSHINATTCSIDTVIKAGSLASSYKFDIRNSNSAGMFANPIITQSQVKPLIQYIERRYDFDIAATSTQNNGYFFSKTGSANTNLYTITIDGLTYSHTNDGTAGSINNDTAVAASIAASINADSNCKCTAAANDGTFHLRLTKKSPTDYFAVSYNSRVTQRLNNKANRVYPFDDAPPQDAILTTLSDTAMSYIETNDAIGSVYYDSKPEANAWMNEEFILKNSSAAGVTDGFYRHYKKGELLNPVPQLLTFKVGQSPLGRCYLNQFSNGPYGYFQPELVMHLGYQCWDDEYNAVYLADSETITPGVTTLVRQPQSFWFQDRVRFTQTESLVPLSGAHVHVRTGLSTYTYLGQLPVLF